ncbi:MAG: 50S ribosomal protein L11 [bacterium]|jgi:large subunit ribosomal protein L11
MAKKVIANVKVQLQGGGARPAPPLGPALGQHGVAIMEFCKQFNAATSDRAGEVIPVVITIYEDKSFTFVQKTAPTSELIKKAIGLDKGSKEPNKIKVGKITREQLRRVAEQKLPDLNTKNLDAAMRIVAGSARQMGVEVVD